MSKEKDRTTWIKIFTVSEPQDHPGGYTVYRVVQTMFPTSSPDKATTLATWKRWSQIKALHRSLDTVHRSLYLPGDFPALPKSSYFNRKNNTIIEERRLAALELLEFAAPFPALFLSSHFQEFFKVDTTSPHQETNTSLEYSVGRVSSPDFVTDLTVSLSNDLSIDKTPTLTPTPVSSSTSTPVSSSTPTPESSCAPTPVSFSTLTSEHQTIDNQDATIYGKQEKEAPVHDADVGNKDGVTSFEDKDGGIPAYITEAATVIAEALSLEAEEKFEASIQAYRSAIGKLLSCVQSDPDQQRQAAVKKRIAQYISKAEQLVQRELEVTCRKQIRTTSGIPHLHLFGHLSELRKYKVVNILDKKIILAQNTETGVELIFKVLQKSAAVFKKSKTSLLPINIAYMVGLLKYFETDEAVYLMLEYCQAGKLWDMVCPLVNQQRTQHAAATSKDFPPKPAVLRPSDSFILQRQVSAASSLSSVVSDTDSDVEDLNIVHVENNSLLIISEDSINHYLCEEEENIKCKEMDCTGDSILDTSREILRSLANESVSVSSEPEILSRIFGMEERIKKHMTGNIGSPPPTTTIVAVGSKTAAEVGGLVEDDSGVEDPNCTQDTSDTMVLATSHTADLDTSHTAVLDTSHTTVLDTSHTTVLDTSHTAVLDTSKTAVLDTSHTTVQDTTHTTVLDRSSAERSLSFHHTEREGGLSLITRPAPRPLVLRKLSEVLPKVPDPDLPDSTFLPDRVVRLWAAELAQVLSSLHYRDIIIRDLNPSNLLLDSAGHIKLTYQCEWVSIERELSPTAVQGRFVAPEVMTVNDITPSADWWSYGAILLLLYTGSGPSSLIPTGLDSSIPLTFPEYMDEQSVAFLTNLLQVYPGNRLGAGTTGSLDIRNHAFFSYFDWNKMTFMKKE